MSHLRVIQTAAAIAILAGLLPAGPLHAASVSNGQKKGAGAAANPQQQQANQAAAQAKAAAIATAQSGVQAAQVALQLVVKKLNTDFQASPELKTAQDAVVAANEAYDKAKAPVLAALPAADPKYKAAKNKEAAAQAKMDAGKKNGATASSLSTVSQTLFDLGNIIGPLEQAAFEKDPACVAAKKNLDDAIAAVSKMTTDFKATIKTNADWVAAKSNLDSAQAGLLAAQNGTAPAVPPAQ